MGLSDYHKIGMRIGATEVTTTVETQVASPFSLDQVRAKGDAIIKARGTAVPYYVLALSPISENRDTKAHVEPFDVATPPDPASGIYGTAPEAMNAALTRYRALKASMPPYCYLAVYHTSDDPARIEDLFLPPPQQVIETHRFSTTQKVAAGAGILGALGILVLVAKH